MGLSFLYFKIDPPPPQNGEMGRGVFSSRHVQKQMLIFFLNFKNFVTTSLRHIFTANLKQIIMSRLNFGEALEALKAGRLVSRSGWNGKSMFLFMRPGDVLSKDIVQNAKSLPQSFKNWAFNKSLSIGHEVGLQEYVFTGYLCMKAADDTIVNGWLASQTDMLSEDWFILD